MTVGRELIAFNGDENEYHSCIVKLDKKNAVIRTGQKNHFPNTSPLVSEIAIGISKGDRLDWVIQKATELGVTAIHPLYTSRCEIKLDAVRSEKKLNSWTQIAISACEQCQRNTLPKIHRPANLGEYLKRCTTDAKFVLHHRTVKDLQDCSPPKSISFLIGPEGGLDDEEIREAEHQGFNALSFGNRVMRTETAPIAALSIAQFLWGDLG